MKLRSFAERLARRTTRRGFFGRGADLALAALAGAAAGSVASAPPAGAGGLTVCVFPGPPCPCDLCLSNGTCAKPCVILTQFYASGCWTYVGVTCCDCDCQGNQGTQWCGCGTDYHNDPGNCPSGTASAA